MKGCIFEGEELDWKDKLYDANGVVWEVQATWFDRFTIFPVDNVTRKCKGNYRINYDGELLRFEGLGKLFSRDVNHWK